MAEVSCPARPAFPSAGRAPFFGAVMTNKARDRGATAVEVALLMPIVLILVMGIVDFGRLLNAKITLTQAAREGVRVVALNKSNPTGKAINAATGLDGVSASVIVSCPAGSAGTKSDELQTSYTFSFVTPVGDLVGMFGGGGFGSPVTLSA